VEKRILEEYNRLFEIHYEYATPKEKISMLKDKIMMEYLFEIKERLDDGKKNGQKEVKRNSKEQDGKGNG
jgi:hypothetical protein